MDIERPLIVMYSFRTPTESSNPYVVELANRVSEHASVLYFSWREALRLRYDVLHVHWPEWMFRASTGVMTRIKLLAMLTLLLLLRVRGIPIVWTVHNIQPHEPGSRLERFVLKRFERNVALRVFLNGQTAAPTTGRAVLIPHGHYRDWFAPVLKSLREQPQDDRIGATLLLFGILRPYKGVEALIAASANFAPGTVHIVGAPITMDYAHQIVALAEKTPAVTLKLERQSDRELAAEIVSAKGVVLPYSAMHNSGVALLALSLDRPILVPKNAANEELQNEVGEQWVTTFELPLTEDDLNRFISRISSIPKLSRPALDGRNWDTIISAHLRAYAAVASCDSAPIKESTNL